MNRPLLVFAHANGFPAGSYRKLFAALADRYRIEAPEKLGHDPRYPVTDNWTLLADELIAFIEARADAPVLGVGHSLGGVLIFKAALRRPELFRAFVMLDPPAFMGMRAWVMRLAKLGGFEDRITPAGKSRSRRTEWPDVETAIAVLRRRTLFRNFDPDCLRDYVESGTVPSPGGVRLVYDPAVETEIFRTIPHTLPGYRRPVGTPGILLCAEDDDVAHRRDVTRLARRHRMRLCWSEGGHMFPLERPRETAERIHRELAALLGEE